jgi:hypothetical protein
MKRKRLVLIATIAVIGVVCCVALYQFGFLFPIKAMFAMSRLRDTSQHLPDLTESVLVDSQEGTAPSPVQGCASVYINKLMASNGLTLTQILDKYDAALANTTWRLTYASDEARIYNTDGETHLAISADSASVIFDKAVLEEGHRRYKILYVVELVAPAEPETPSAKCTGN